MLRFYQQILRITFTEHIRNLNKEIISDNQKAKTIILQVHTEERFPRKYNTVRIIEEREAVR